MSTSFYACKGIDEDKIGQRWFSGTATGSKGMTFSFEQPISALEGAVLFYDERGHFLTRTQLMQVINECQTVEYIG